MRKLLFIYIAFSLFFLPGMARSCVNLDINVGAVDSAQGRLYAAIISTFIHERTGTKSIVKFYPDMKTLHDAIADKEVELIVADVADALHFGSRSTGNVATVDFQAAKKIYKEQHLIVMPPLGLLADDSSSKMIIAPVLAKVVLEKFPALPRLLKKLSGKIDARVAAKLLALVREKGKKNATVAKNFLVSKRLI